VESRVMQTWNDWVKTTLSPEYKAHFHKNYCSGSKDAMRLLWSKSITSPDDIPHQLTGVSFVAPNSVEYKKLNKSTGGYDNVIATTLHGMLTKHIPDISNDLYQHIIDKDQYFQWETRGPKIFSVVTSYDEDMNCAPDIVALSEYDVHDAPATVYTPGHREERFPEAMARAGYAGGLFSAPKISDCNGIGVFWRRDVFSLAGDCSRNEESIVLLPGDRRAGAINVDLHEHWHRLYAGQCSGKLEEMPEQDRRNAGAVRLVHNPSGREVLVVFAHLMTESRDCAATNEYVGEVRAGELHNISKLVAEHLTEYPHTRAALLVGDFNIDVREREMLCGRLRSHLTQKSMTVSTGFDDSYDPLNPSIVYAGKERVLRLQEAFTSLHQWGAGIGYDKYCTSFTSNRCKWIDMIWHTPDTLRVERLSDMRCPESFIPNQQHGSDHLPLSAVFRFL